MLSLYDCRCFTASRSIIITIILRSVSYKHVPFRPGVQIPAPPVESQHNMDSLRDLHRALSTDSGGGVPY